MEILDPREGTPIPPDRQRAKRPRVDLAIIILLVANIIALTDILSRLHAV